MVEHLVLFEFESLSAEGEKELVDLASSFKDHIPGILELSFGRNISPGERAQGFNYALRVKFQDVSCLRNYGPHPKHQEFVQAISPYKKNLICVDFQDEISFSQ